MPISQLDFPAMASMVARTPNLFAPVSGGPGSIGLSATGELWNRINAIGLSPSCVAFNKQNNTICLLTTLSANALRSTDNGQSWQVAAMPDFGNWGRKHLINRNNLFCAIGGQSGTGFFLSAISNDAISWQTAVNPAIPFASNSGIAYGNGNFCTLSDDGVTAYLSPDGLNWTPHLTGFVGGQILNITFNGRKFCAVESNAPNFVLTSQNGVNWQQTFIPNHSWNVITTLSNLFCIFSQTNQYLTSPDSINWTPRVLPLNETIVAADSNNNIVCALTQPGNCLTSPDGINWTISVIGFQAADLTFR